MFGGAAALSVLEALTPGGPSTDLTPGLIAFVFALTILAIGRRVPVTVLAALGPVGAVLVAYGLATTPGGGDSAVLYVWPVLLEAYFFGRRATFLMVIWVGIVHGLALASLPSGVGYVDRWIDVFFAVAVVGLVTELLAHRNRELVARLASEAQVDQLTGLLNRRGFKLRAGEELARAQRSASSVGVVSFDLDHFKRVNDALGHDAGDRTLMRVSDELRAATRTSDVLARMGGEEFVALVSGGVPEARTFAERVRVAMDTSVDPATRGMTISAGVAAAVAPTDLEALLKRADAALYEAKSAGRNRTVVAAPRQRISDERLESLLS